VAEIAIPGFSIVKKITDGGSASIFKAKKHPYETLCALKVLLPQFAGNKDMLKAFDHEVEVLARLKHPNVIKSSGKVKDAPRPTCELELFESNTIKALIAKAGGKLPIADTAKIMKQVAEALSYVHVQEIAHFDIKPENILADDKLEVRLIDFSIAKSLKKSMSDRLLSVFAKKGGDGTIQGTLTYLAPEQIKREDPGTPADIYSLGLVTYECLIGGPPFRGHDQKTIMKQHIQDQAPGVEKGRPDAPPEIAALVKRMLEKDPAKRPDATAVAQLFAKHAG
jgi:serine/threonine-protein kinase